jgi:hypothetical protein
MTLRKGIFDWIPRTAISYLTSAMILFALSPSKVHNMQPNSHLKDEVVFGMKKLSLFNRITLIYLILMWVYPISQLDSVDSTAIEKDLQTPEPRTAFLWYAYSIGLLARVCSLVNAVDSSYIEKFYSTVVGIPQIYVFNSLLFELYQRTDFRNWKRVGVFATTAVAWETDTLALVMDLLPEKTQGKIVSPVLYSMMA